MLHSVWQQIWKTQQWPQDWERSVFIPISKKGSAKECSNYHTIAGLKVNIQKTKIMASCPITSWQIDGETMETETFGRGGASRIIADGDCSHEIKRCLLLGRKAVTNLDRDITLPTKVRLVKAMIFPLVMHRCELVLTETWMQRIDAFDLSCWRRLFRVPWNARRSNQSILKEISPKYSLVGLMLKLKLQYFGYQM